MYVCVCEREIQDSCGIRMGLEAQACASLSPSGIPVNFLLW